MSIGLVMLTAPLGIGLLIRHFKRNWSDFIELKVIKPFSFFFIVVVFGVNFNKTVTFVM